MNERYEERVKNKEARALFEGRVEDRSSILESVDELILRAGIKNKFPFVTAEIFIIIVAIVSFGISYIIQITLESFLISLVAFFGSVTIIFASLKMLSRTIYDLVDDQILVVVNTMLNVSNVNSDIVEIFEKSSISMKYPLRGYVEKFTSSRRKGTGVESAFNRLIDDVSSENFRTLFTNLMIASKHGANYAKVLDKFRSTAEFNLEDKARRKKKVSSARAEIFLFCALCGLMVFVTTKLVDDFKHVIQSNPLVYINILYIIAVMFFAIYKLISIDKVGE